MSCPAPLTLFALIASLGCAAQTTPRARAVESEGLVSGAGEQLPAWLRPIVRTQMARQWEYVNELRWTAASLEFDRTRELAQKIVQEIHCGRPGEAGAPMDAVVPARYLDLQEGLREQALRLSVVASSGNARLVSNAYHAMVDACTRCHSAYRPGPPLELPLISANDE